MWSVSIGSQCTSHRRTRQRLGPIYGPQAARAGSPGAERVVPLADVSISPPALCLTLIVSATTISCWVIRSYGDKDTQAVAERRRARKLPEDIQRRAQRKLMILNNATNLDDLRIPPGNRLKALSGDRAGQHSIRLNNQWRVCFVWRDGNAYQVKIVEYH